MRLITLRYAAECVECRTALAVGATAGYERGCGTYCPEHLPTDPEVVRELRQDVAERKAERREAWAAARQRHADAAAAASDALLCRDPETGRADWALVTQPGYIPQRARANRLTERAWSEQRAADAHSAKAAAYRRPVRVAGDAAARHAALNEAARARLIAAGLATGQRVCANPYQGEYRVLRLNKQTVSVIGASGWRTTVGYPDVELLAD